MACGGIDAPENGNNVEATYDFFERSIFYDKLIRRFWQQS